MLLFKKDFFGCFLLAFKPSLLNPVLFIYLVCVDAW